MANGHRGIEKLQHVVCLGVECLGDVLIRLTITAGRGDRVGGDPAGLNSSLPARQGSLCVSVRGSQPDLTQCVNIGWCSPILTLVYFSSNTHCFQS